MLQLLREAPSYVAFGFLLLALCSYLLCSPLCDVFYAKTGTMSNVNALSGVVGDVAFSILSDACPLASATVRQGIDDIAVLFATIPPL